MAIGSNLYNIGYTLVLLNVSFAFIIHFRQSFDSPHPQDSWSHGRMVFWIRREMVQRFGGHPSFSTPLKITMPTLLFESSPCPVFDHALLLVRDVTGFGVPTLLKLCPFPPLRLSFRATDDFPPFPFSDTHYVLRNNVFRGPSLTGQLYLTCRQCWIHVRHVSHLCELCGGCEFWNSIGFELDIL